MRLALKIGIGVVAVFGLIQAVQLDRTNPAVSGDVDAAPEVKNTLRRACYDCHSNETTWPWYSRVAPSSWLVHYDVYDGRKTLNFSEWASQAPEHRAKLREEIGESVAEGDMPPWYYTPLHSNARLSDADRRLLQTWAASGDGNR